ncbi:unnamed protein product [Discula destructiva]
MSGYPFGYPYQGGQPPPPPPPPPQQQQQQQQYPPYQSYGAYPHANGFGATAPQSQQPQHYPPPTNSFFANAQSAYDYNASSIPGLGTPSSASPFPTPYNGAWNQGGYGNGAPQAQYPAYSPSVPNVSAPTTHPYSQGPAPAAQTQHPAIPSKPAPLKKQHEPAPKPQLKPQPAVQPKLSASKTEDQQEDGEIDDGYFDDLYDDASKTPSVTNENAPAADKASENTVREGSGQEPNFYDTDKEEVTTMRNVTAAIAPEKTQHSTKLPDRGRSMSYSPHLSFEEIRGSAPPGQAAADKGKAGAQPKAQPVLTAAGASPTLIPLQSSESHTDKCTNPQSVAAMVASVKSISTASKSFASVSEAHNEAKKAILRLLPHGVKYQTYIDEGFDAALVKDLFTQLNLPTGQAVSDSSEKPTAPQVKENQALKPQLPQSTQTDTMAKKQEERKDRIARLMAEKQAEKKAKLAAASGSAENATKPSTSSSSTASALLPPAKPPTTRAEKDRLLQQKVEALRAKAREAKKLAQKTSSLAVPTPSPNAAQSLRPSQAPTTNAQPSVAAQSAVGTPLSSASQSAASSPAIAALSLLPRAGIPPNQRKRPVAADFMDLPSAAVKRPSLANRENSSLIISVSDEEDDDDDVEMEVESTTEDPPTPLQQSSTLPRRGPSIRDYPPLKDFTNARQVPSPVSGTSSSGSKNANTDLQSKEREIMEMNKRIKELEAKKQAKARSRNATPRSPSAGGSTPTEQAPKSEPPRNGHTTLEQILKTPMRHVLPSSEADDKTTPSAQLLQEAEAASVPSPLSEPAVSDFQLDDKRQDSRPSARVAGKSAKALAKAERLRRMQEEMRRLQAELEQEDDGESVEEQRSEQGEACIEADAVEVTQGMSELTADEAVSQNHINKPVETIGSAEGLEEAASTQRPSDAASHNQPMDIDSSSAASGSGMNVDLPSRAISLLDQLAPGTPTLNDLARLPDSANSADAVKFDRDEPAVGDLGELDDYEPPEPKVTINSDSPPLNPVSAAASISVQQPRAQVAEKVTNGVEPARQTSFAPYVSPLRYYHAYRFHPTYNDGIQGGLKSLTYSNKIDPNKEMCPDEWEGNDCPRGAACQFQHFQSIVTPDSEIILELGSSDEFSGEKKREFNNGLREVVASFQKSKVRDFRTIAGAILDFRRRFLGDPSKVLRLEGVNT